MAFIMISGSDKQHAFLLSFPSSKFAREGFSHPSRLDIKIVQEAKICYLSGKKFLLIS